MHVLKAKTKNNSTLPIATTIALSMVLSSTVQSVMGQSISKSERAGTGVYEAVINETDGTIFVTSAGSRTNPGGAIYRFKPEDLSVIDQFSLTDNPPFGIGFNNKTQTLYTTNTRTNSVSAIDARTGKVLATITNGKDKSHTREVLVDEGKNLIYVSDVGDPSSIWVIDGKTNSFIHAIENTGKTTTGMAFNKAKDQLYITNMGTNEVGVIDLKTKKLVKSFSSGGENPVNIDVDHKGNRIFVTNQGSGDVAVLDGKDGSLIKTIQTGAGAIGITYDPERDRIFSANRQTGTTTIIDGKTYQILADLSTGSHPNSVKVNKKTGAAYVVNKTKMVRPAEGEPAPPADENGDTLTLILP